MSNFYILAAGEGDIVSGEMMSEDGTAIAAEEIQQTGADGSNGGVKEPPRRQPTIKDSLIWMIPLFVIMYLLMFRGPKKKQQQHQKMVKALQKNDKVRTIGGILGTVIDVKDDEITLKIDESNNTKVRITPGAVSKVVSNEAD